MEIQTLILANVLSSGDYCRRVIPYLKPEYFEGSHRTFFDSICKYVAKYSDLPNQSALSVELGNLNLGESARTEVSTLLTSVYQPINAMGDTKWLMDTTEKWVKDRALNIALLESWESYTGKSKTLNKDAIPMKLQEALSISFDQSIGHDYFEDALQRFQNMKNKVSKIPFCLQVLNEITNGGAELKTLNCLLAGTNVGKSLAMSHLAADYISQGHDVLYITMEMADEKIGHRIDANLLDIDISSLDKYEAEFLHQKLLKKRKKTYGRLIIKEFPTGIANVNHFRAVLEELKLKKGYNPKIVFIDYINICASITGETDSYGKIKKIAEQLRGFAVEKELIIWTATQLTRDGMKNSDVDMTNTSESIGLPQTVDFLLAMMQDEEMAAAHQYLCKQLKSRYADPNKKLRFTLGVEKGNMRLFEVANNTAGIMNGPAAPSTAKSKPGRQVAEPADDKYSAFKFEE